MAGAEVAVAVVGPAAKSVCGPLCGFVCSKIDSAVNLPSNLGVMVNEMVRLRDLKKDVEDAAETDENEIRGRVKTWLEDVEKIESRFNPIKKQMDNKNYKKPSACFLNCCKRYTESTEVDEIRKEIKRLLEDGIDPNNVAFKTRKPRAVDPIPGPSIRSQTTASKVLDNTKKLLYRYRRIGIWGMGGIGKTALVNNLNNELNNSISTESFGIVIFATVSMNVDMKEIQTQIAERLNLEVKSEERVPRMASRLYEKLMKVEKFLLILDDVWEKIDLFTLGVPRPDEHTGYKIILTSRDLEVCRKMLTDIDVKMKLLNDEEAWQLFCQNAGEVVHLEEIKPIAEKVSKASCGLPLSIIAMGAAMRRKTKYQWEDALKDLQRPVPPIGSIDKDVYKSLKLSYDSLQDHHTKSCFLYCSMFPKGSSIKISALEQYWLAEGLIEKQHSINKLIDRLKESCLLEVGADKGTVKMHDTVREVAIQIASSSEDGDKSLVLLGGGSSEISAEDFSNSDSLKRVSFMCNEITSLPDCEIKCSKASTLLLQGNRFLKKVPERFLLGFVALKVLNLSETSIQSLPDSIMKLGDLRALLLRNCSFLGELPPLGELSKLEMLDLSGTHIRELSEEMGKLSNLRQLDLSQTYKLETIQAGIISKLSRLESLDMTDSAYELLVKTEEDRGKVTFEELSGLKQLRFLFIRLIPGLNSEDLSWINRLDGFQISIGKTRGISITRDKRVIVGRVDFLKKSIWQLWSIAESLVLYDCRGMDEMLEDLVIKSVGCFTGLKVLSIEGKKLFDTRVRVIGGLAAKSDLLPNLEELALTDLNVLTSISELVGHLKLGFPRLKLIEVSDCSDMKYLLSCGDSIRTLPKLEEIKVRDCFQLDELFNYDSGQNMAPHSVVPNLRILELNGLPNLKTLCKHKETWPCLEQVEVLKCDLLKRLPLTNQNARTVKEIKGESKWWDALEWDNDADQIFRPYFHPTLPEL